MFYNYIKKSLQNIKNIIYVENYKQKIPITIHSKKLPDYNGFNASELFARKIIKIVIKNENFYIIDGYVTYRRNIKFVKKISYKKLFWIFRKPIIIYKSDENDIINYLKKNNILYKKNFDEKRLKNFYYFWKSAYAIVTNNEYEEISKRQFLAIHIEFQKYKHKLKKEKLNLKKQKMIEKIKK